jgi:hypothetical protein
MASGARDGNEGESTRRQFSNVADIEPDYAQRWRSAIVEAQMQLVVGI